MNGKGYDDWPLGAPEGNGGPEKPAEKALIHKTTHEPVDMSPEAVRERMVGANSIDLRHANQERVSDESDWKVECPFCDDGLFLIHRNQNHPYELVEYDNCIACGQIVRWVDIDEMRQKDGISP